MKRHGASAAILAIVFATSLFGQVRDHAPLVLPQYTIGMVRSETPPQTETTQSIVAWKASSPLLDYHVHGDNVCVTGPPGTYTLTQEITTITVDWDNKKFSLSQSVHATPITVSGTVLPDDPPVEPLPPVKVTRVTYVYEKDQNAIPRGVSSALQKLNARGITATEFERDTVDGNGKVPAQYLIPKDAATQVGLPALVIQSSLRVLDIVKNPQTEADVMEAIP